MKLRKQILTIQSKPLEEPLNTQKVLAKEVEPPDSLKDSLNFLQLYTVEILHVYQLAKSIFLIRQHVCLFWWKVFFSKTSSTWINSQINNRKYRLGEEQKGRRLVTTRLLLLKESG